ncbi:redoxin family protein [Candidatus Marsarchaeota archaeon]|jgi:thiol-disulfide isomerase/thioredoxin|nr:redoxin family protein [Candidatus Marsarchaeota archaeon]MCL5092904.1 redoxin family protein [Candidatus Marsarchaeota archaeon]
MKKKYLYSIIALAVILILVAAYWYNSIQTSASQASSGILNAGSEAPNANFTLPSGALREVSNYNGKPLLVYFVATWCSSCVAGTQAIARNMSFFSNKNITVLELELYNNLGYSGPPINDFVNTSSANASDSSRIISAYASYRMSELYDSKAYLDLYYLINKNGQVVYVSGSPSITMPQLKSEVDSLA